MKVRAIKSILVLIILVSFISCNKDSQEDNVKVNPNPDSTIVSMSRKMFYDLSNHNENYSETFFYDSLNRLISKSESRINDDGDLVQFYYNTGKSPFKWIESWIGETKIEYTPDTIRMINGSNDTLLISFVQKWICGKYKNNSETSTVEILYNDEGNIIYAYRYFRWNHNDEWSFTEDSLKWNNGNCIQVDRYFSSNYNNVIEHFSTTHYEYDAKQNYFTSQHWPIEYIYSKLFSNAYSLDLLISYLNKNNTLVKTVISDDNYTRVYQHNITSYSSQGFPLKEKNLTDSTVFEYY